MLTGTGTRSYFRPSTRTAERRPHTPANTNTDATSETLTSTAATNGPTTTLNESSRPRTTLMDVSSSGARQSKGIRAEWLARYGVKAMVETIARAYTIQVGPPAIRIGAVSTVARPRTALETNSTFSRGRRSAYVDTTGASRAAGTRRSRPTSPTATAPPSAYATRLMATVNAHSAV